MFHGIYPISFTKNNKTNFKNQPKTPKNNKSNNNNKNHKTNQTNTKTKQKPPNITKPKSYLQIWPFNRKVKVTLQTLGSVVNSKGCILTVYLEL